MNFALIKREGAGLSQTNTAFGDFLVIVPIHPWSGIVPNLVGLFLISVVVFLFCMFSFSGTSTKTSFSLQYFCKLGQCILTEILSIYGPSRTQVQFLLLSVALEN